MNLLHPFQNLKIRNKLLVSYSSAFILVIAVVSVGIYSIVKSTIEKNIESELKNSTATILNTVKTSAAVSLKNYFRAVAEKNLEITQYYYSQYQQGLLSDEAAREKAGAVILSQVIGKSGYIYCIGSNGVIKVHPQKSLIGVDISSYAFAREQKAKKKGYLEYDWKNPGEPLERPKALYMTYFKPWDWIISVTSYRKEFRELVKVDDFRQSVLSLRFGKTGYSFVMDTKGNLIIHPVLEGQNFYAQRDAGGRPFVQQICERKAGKIVYPWKNPGEEVARQKLVIFNHIPEYDWIVASSSYEDEFFAPLNTIGSSIFITALISLLLLFPISLRIGSSITSPLQELMDRFSSVPAGNFTVRIKPQSQDEVGQLAHYFNLFMDRLDSYGKELRGEIRERQQAEYALRLSEEMFSKAFSLSPNGICITTRRDGRFINVNTSFLYATGYSSDEVIGKTFQELNFFASQQDYAEMFADLENHGKLRNYEVEYVTKTGNRRLALISADFIELWNEQCMLATLEDITDIKQLENRILNIGEKERQKIGQDLHDDLCPHLIGIEVLTKVLQHRLENGSPEEAKQAANIRSLIKAAINKTRGMARGLCPVNLVDRGFESAIEELARNMENVFGISCVFNYDCPVGFNNNADATHLFYIIQEAVHNAIKHGRASAIEITASMADGKMTLNIIDDGIGISESRNANGIGLRIMAFRAQKVGASFAVGSNRAGGTTVTISLRRDRTQAQEENGRR